MHCTIPKKMEKRKGIFQGKNGKFQPHPSNVDYPHPSNTDNPHPSNTDSGTCPSNTDKKENLEIFKRDIKRDSKSLFLKKFLIVFERSLHILDRFSRNSF
jgi:hypothetical protein